MLFIGRDVFVGKRWPLGNRISTLHPYEYERTYVRACVARSKSENHSTKEMAITIETKRSHSHRSSGIESESEREMTVHKSVDVTIFICCGM